MRRDESIYLALIFFHSVMDKNDNDSLWVRVFYNDSERDEIEDNLKRIYTLLLSDGSTDVLRFLNVDAVDYCTFGNTSRIT